MSGIIEEREKQLGALGLFFPQAGRLVESRRSKTHGVCCNRRERNMTRRAWSLLPPSMKTRGVKGAETRGVRRTSSVVLKEYIH